MALMDSLEQAQGGRFFAGAGRIAGLDAAQAEAAMRALSPAIAQALRKRARDDAAFDKLLDVIEDGQGDAFLDDPAALADPEVLADGRAILKDIYGSEAKFIKTGRALVPDLSDTALRKLMAIAASAVLAVLVRTNRGAMALSAAEPEARGDGLLGTIVSAVIEGAIKGATRSLSTRTRRVYSRRRKPARKRTQRPSLESIFGELLGLGGR